VAKIPIAAFNGGVRCYGCGEPGHKKGSAECKADRNAVHSSAPEEYKQKRKQHTSRRGTGVLTGTSSDGNTPMNEKPCYQFDFGKGVCRYGAKCKFSHNRNGGGVDKGGSRKFTSNPKKKIFKEAAPSGVGGGGLHVEGIGPLIVRAETGKYFLDPEGVFRGRPSNEKDLGSAHSTCSRDSSYK